MNTSNLQTVLVTGAAGLIGSEVARKLLNRGTRVVAMDRDGIEMWSGSWEGLVWEQGELSDPNLEARLGHHHVDLILHCAAHPGGESLQEPALDVQINAHVAMRIFEFCAKANIPVIYLSSSVIYGDQPQGPISEEAPLHLRVRHLRKIKNRAAFFFLRGMSLIWEPAVWGRSTNNRSGAGPPLHRTQHVRIYKYSFLALAAPK